MARIATAGLDTIALRVPGHRAMQALLAATGAPLAAPSANASGRVSPTKAEHVLASLDGRVALVIDDGATMAGVESTIARVTDGAVEVLRRLGARDFAADEFGIGFGALAGDYNLSAVGDLTEAAAHLFDALHAGAASAKPRIAVAEIPAEGLGAAINDRLARAAV